MGLLSSAAASPRHSWTVHLLLVVSHLAHFLSLNNNYTGCSMLGYFNPWERGQNTEIKGWLRKQLCGSDERGSWLYIYQDPAPHHDSPYPGGEKYQLQSQEPIVHKIVQNSNEPLCISKSACFKMSICLLPLVTEENDKPGVHANLKSPGEP